jgi:UPF0755 protein
LYKILKIGILASFSAGLVAAGSFGLWLHLPLSLQTIPLSVAVDQGASGRDVAKALAQNGVTRLETLLYLWFRLSGQARDIKAGNYELKQGTTPYSLLRIMVRGEASLKTVTLLEGWSFKQFRRALVQSDDLKQETSGWSDEQIMAQLGRPGSHPEGRFFPDTYAYVKGSSDLSVLKRAMTAMDQQLDAAWQSRSDQQVLKSPDQALILASIVEKETGLASDRAQISAVFHNRLRLGMMLQTDPTVIYGLGDRFDGNLRRLDLRQDTPWNTYTRQGLPPTPIAMPGKAALRAAVQPQNSPALFFVARGDGSSVFSVTLEDHNRAVNRYQRGQP